MEIMKKNIMMMEELKKHVFFKISHELEESLEISIRRDHILGGVSVQEGNIFLLNKPYYQWWNLRTSYNIAKMIIGSRP